MRHCLLILMIALLPLRAWAGDAMAGEMLAQQLIAINSIAAEHATTRGSGSFDHETAALAMPDCHGQAASPADAAQAHHTASAGNACSQCQACSSAALQPSATLLPAVPGPQALPATGTPQFASALPAAAFKPPIF